MVELSFTMKGIMRGIECKSKTKNREEVMTPTVEVMFYDDSGHHATHC